MCENELESLGHKKIKKMYIIGTGASPEGLKMLRGFELKDEGPYSILFKHNQNDEITGIVPYYVHDNGITIGYGHWISQEEYNKDVNEKALVDKYIPKGTKFDDELSSNHFPVPVPNATAVPIDVVNTLFASDVAERTPSIDAWLESDNISLTQTQFDALIPFKYLYGNLYTVGIPDLVKNKASKKQWEEIFVYGIHSGKDHMYAGRNQQAIDLYFTGVYP